MGIACCVNCGIKVTRRPSPVQRYENNFCGPACQFSFRRPQLWKPSGEADGHWQLDLGSDRHVLADDADMHIVRQYTWRINVRRAKDKERAYVISQRPKNEQGARTVYLHQIIMGAVAKGGPIDHKNRNPLDCRRHNLRLATRFQNACNTPNRNPISGYRGVKWNRDGFQARIQWQGQFFCLGNFPTAEQAARVRDAKAYELHGEFAVLNFPHEDAGG